MLVVSVLRVLPAIRKGAESASTVRNATSVHDRKSSSAAPMSGRVSRRPSSSAAISRTLPVLFRQKPGPFSGLGTAHAVESQGLIPPPNLL